MIDLKELISDPWTAAFIVLINQIIFIYCRTLNVMYVSEKKVLAAIVSGNLIGIAWLISIAIGASAIMSLQWQPILTHLIGGSLGTYWGFKTRK